MEQVEPKWTQVDQSGHKWIKVDPSGPKWTYVNDASDIAIIIPAFYFTLLPVSHNPLGHTNKLGGVVLLNIPSLCYLQKS